MSTDKIKDDEIMFLSPTLIQYPEGIMVINCEGFIMPYSQVKQVTAKMLSFAKLYEQEILEDNKRRRNSINEKPKKIKATPDGYIYLVKCENKYKIGVTKNIKQRLKQLDTRPFNLEVIKTTSKIKNVYQVEKELHNKLKPYRITGEWYDLDKSACSVVIKCLEGLERIAEEN